MIKLVASDLDGTILLNGAQEVDESLIKVVDHLTEQGVIFAPASGRQRASLQRLFGPIADKLMYIAENGALVTYHDQVIAKTPMDRELAMRIIEDVDQIPNCELLISGEHTAYINPKTKEYEYRMTKVVKYHTTFIDDFHNVPEDILKIAVCDLSGIKNSKEHFLGKWSKLAATAVSGELYLDFTDLSANKGNAMKQIQKKMGISPDECMAFGDNFNDLEMLESVTHSYAMEKAVDEIKKHAEHVTPWVEQTLREKFHL